MIRRVTLGLAALVLACEVPTVRADIERVDPPPIYAQWWAEVEDCSGQRAPMARVEWYSVLATGEYGAFECELPQGCAGYWKSPHRIYVSDHDTLIRATVAHEMLHDLLQTGGHPPAFDRCGLTTGVVR
jgi:hypothetical protein